MNTIDSKYQDLLQDILDNGVEKQDRTGTGTISVFGRQIRHKMSEGFPLLTTKKIHWNSIVTELLWFLRGDTNIKFLLDYNCHIWDGDAFKHYTKVIDDVIDGYRCGDIMGMQSHMKKWFSNSDELTPLTKKEFINKIKTDDEFAKKWGSLGPVYGKQWRCWKRYRRIEDTEHKETLHIIDYVDQIQNLINELKTNPDSRRLMVSAWNVGELDQMVLPPCHYGFQVYTRELSLEERFNLFSIDSIDRTESYSKWLDDNKYPKRAISLMWNQRSVDTFLGLPFNIASYGLLLEILAKLVNMVPDELIGNLGDTHLYSNHIEQAKEQIGRDLTDEERYNKWFNNNYETGMERFFDPNKLPEYGNSYYEPTPKRTKEPFKLPKLNINTEFWPTENGECGVGGISIGGFINGLNDDNFIRCLLEDDIQLFDYQSHPKIKAHLNN